jgi:hypothetical protein
MPTPIDEHLHKVQLAISKKGLYTAITSINFIYTILILSSAIDSLVSYMYQVLPKVLGIEKIIMSLFLFLFDLGILKCADQVKFLGSFIGRGLLMLFLGFEMAFTGSPGGFGFGITSWVLSLLYLILGVFSSIKFPVFVVETRVLEEKQTLKGTPSDNV